MKHLRIRPERKLEDNENMNDDFVTGLALGFLVGMFFVPQEPASPRPARRRRVKVYDTPPLMSDEDWAALYDMLERGEDEV